MIIGRSSARVRQLSRATYGPLNGSLFQGASQNTHEVGNAQVDDIDVNKSSSQTGEQSDVRAMCNIPDV